MEQLKSLTECMWLLERSVISMTRKEFESKSFEEVMEQLNEECDDVTTIDILKDFNQKGKWIAAICAGPISLEKAGIIENKQFTCYPGFENEIPSGIYQDSFTCIDQNIITGRGPAAALEFAYTILEKLGVSSTNISQAMQYHYLKK